MKTYFRRTIPRLVHGVSLAIFMVAVFAMPMIGNSAQVKPSKKKAPAASAAAGRILFVNKCSVCHGSSGQGDEGPNLHGLKMDDATITSIIETGFKGEMPAFKSKLKAQEMKSLIAYIRTFKK